MFDGNLFVRKRYDTGEWCGRVEFMLDTRLWYAKIHEDQVDMYLSVKSKSVQDAMKLVDGQLIEMGYRLLEEGDKLLSLV